MNTELDRVFRQQLIYTYNIRKGYDSSQSHRKISFFAHKTHLMRFCSVGYTHCIVLSMFFAGRPPKQYWLLIIVSYLYVTTQLFSRLVFCFAFTFIVKQNQRFSSILYSVKYLPINSTQFNFNFEKNVIISQISLSLISWNWIDLIWPELNSKPLLNKLSIIDLLSIPLLFYSNLSSN